MTARKKGTDEAKPTTRSSRKKSLAAEPNPQQSLIQVAAPTEAHAVESRTALRASESEPAQAISPATGESDPVPATPLASSRELVSAGTPTWLLATNNLNLLYMLGAGMLMGPAGFSGKHYSDPSSQLSGSIPLFRDCVPEAAIQQAVSEHKHLRPCIAELNLAGLAGPVALISRSGDVSSDALPLTFDSEASALLVRAPLPLSLITRVVFRTPADRREFEVAARGFANIDLSDLSIDVSEQLFLKAQPMVWPLHERPGDTAQILVDQPPARGEAIGGCLAMLYQLANRGDLGASVFRTVSGADTAEDRDAVQRDPVLAELGSWLASGSPRSDSAAPAQLLWGAAQALVDTRLSGSAERPVDTVIGYLESQLSGLKDSAHQARLERLISDMRSTFGLGGGTISQLFERHKGTLSRPLLLFCLRERCVDLLEFSHPHLSEEELLVAAILFGIRDGWIGLPVELRTATGLSRYVEHRMFEAESSQRGHQLSLKPTPSRPMPLRELLVKSQGAWSEAHQTSLAKVVTQLGWLDCVISKIRFSLGWYRLNISSDGLEVVSQGKLDPPSVEVDRKGLLERISRWPPLPRDQERELRATLGPTD